MNTVSVENLSFEMSELLTCAWSADENGCLVAEWPNGAGYYKVVRNTVEVYAWADGVAELVETWSLNVG
jgi:hypothetical protein